MNHDPPIVDHARSDDQQAVVDYFASETYAKRQCSFEMRRSPGAHRVIASIDDGTYPAASFWIGLLGLGGLLTLLGGLMPFGLHGLESFFGSRPNFIVQMFAFYLIVVPPIVAFSFATVTPMFWYGSVTVRFVTGILSVIPGCAAFFCAMSSLEGNPPADFWVGFSAVMFAQFLTAGTVALTVQMWSPWTLSHARRAGTALPPPGTRAMMELTGVAAVGCAILASVDKFEIVEGLMFFTVVGLLSSLAVISLLIAFLRPEHRSVMAASLAGLFAFGTAVPFAGFFAVAEFGWQSLRLNILIVAAVSVFGGSVICGVMWLCLWWLRRCGWRCVSRDEERRDRATGADQDVAGGPKIDRAVARQPSGG